MRQHHRIQQADAFCEPCRADMRRRVQHARGKEEHGELALGEAVALEEPVGDERGAQKATAQTVDAEKRGQLRDSVVGFAILNSRHRCWWYRRELDALRERGVWDDGDHRRAGAEREHQAMRGGKRGGQPAERVPAVERQVVPGQRPRPPRRIGCLRKDRLLERARGSAVASHAVEHADERGGNQQRQPRRRCGRDETNRREQRDEDERAAAADAIRGDRHDRRHHRDAGETAADDETRGGDRHAALGERDGEDDAGETDRRRAQQRCEVDQRGVTRH